MPKSELQNMMKTLDVSSMGAKTHVANPLRKLINTSPPPMNIPKTKTVASIPHKNKTAPYLD